MLHIIATTGAIDRETMSSHSFYVTATDGGGLAMTVIYTIAVLDVNDNSPVFSTGDFHAISLDEDHELTNVCVRVCNDLFANLH